MIFHPRRRIPIRVGDIMTTPVITIHRDAKLEEAAKLMYDNRIGSVLVVDGSGKLVGIVTERDMIYAVSNLLVGKGIPVWEIMTENPITARPEDPLPSAIQKMVEARIRHLPVVDEEGKPVGMVSIRDLTDGLLAYLSIFGGLKVTT